MQTCRLGERTGENHLAEQAGRLGNVLLALSRIPTAAPHLRTPPPILRPIPRDPQKSSPLTQIRGRFSRLTAKRLLGLNLQHHWRRMAESSV